MTRFSKWDVGSRPSNPASYSNITTSFTGLRRSVTEAQLQDAVTALAKMRGWMAYHTYDSRRSEPGFPDLVLVHEDTGILVFVELKSAKGKMTPAQKRWRAAIEKGGHRYRLWTPTEWFDGSVDAILIHPEHRGR